jgi:hypothetical protein
MCPGPAAERLPGMSERLLPTAESDVLPASSPSPRWPWRAPLAGGIASLVVGALFIGHYPVWTVHSSRFLYFVEFDLAVWAVVWFVSTLLVLRLLHGRRILSTALAGAVIAVWITGHFVLSATYLTWDRTIHNDLWLVVLAVVSVVGMVLAEWLVARWSWSRLGVCVVALVAATWVVGAGHERLHQDRIDELPPAYGLDSDDWTETTVAYSYEGYPTVVDVDVVDRWGRVSFAYLTTGRAAIDAQWACYRPARQCVEVGGEVWAPKEAGAARLYREVDGRIIKLTVNPRRVPTPTAARAMATLRPLTGSELDELDERYR